MTQDLDVNYKLIECIDQFKSFYFQAGAGAGKTHALVNIIDYILRKKFLQLRRNNQIVSCVTYTNVAANEIKNRIGSSDVLAVSTIHEMLWNLIQNHQPQLLKLHHRKIKDDIQLIETELSNPDIKKLVFYTSLSDEDRRILDTFIYESKNTYYRTRNLKSKELKEEYKIYYEEFGEENVKRWLKNVSNFRQLASKIYTLKRLKACSQKITNKEPGYTLVEYDSNYNVDRLYRMKFSHDTLLEYSLQLAQGYPVLRQLILDRSPYFFIDEYQDTSENVISILKLIHEHSEKHKRDWLVGYFGDSSQNIYEDGVGSNLATLHQGLVRIKHEFNRRSHEQIIDIINKIRTDGIEQSLLDKSKSNGLVEFYKLNNKSSKEELDSVPQFLEEYKAGLRKSAPKSKITCLVLTNKLMCQLNGFGDIYDAVRSSDNIYFDDIKNKLLSNDLNKLHPVIRLILRIVTKFNNINNSKSTYHDIFERPVKNLSFKSANELINNIRSIKPSTLHDLIKNMSDLYESQKEHLGFKEYIESCLGPAKSDLDTYPSIESMIRAQILDLMVAPTFPSDTSIDSNSNEISDDESNAISDEQIDRVNSILGIEIGKWRIWADVVNQKLDKDITYRTYHSTKGEEYENVAVIMGHNFGGSKGKFKKYFEFIALDEHSCMERFTDEDTKKDIENTRHLVYVACSRAEKNLKVLYIDDTSDIEKGIKSIFGEIKEWVYH